MRKKGVWEGGGRGEKRARREERGSEMGRQKGLREREGEGEMRNL